MLGVAASLALALVLVIAAAAKLAAPRSSQSALATFGLSEPRARWTAWGSLVAPELVLAAGVAAGLEAAAYAAAALLAGFAAAQLLAIRRGRAGAPCGCFGSRSRVGWPGVARDALLAAAFLALPLVPRHEPSTDEWLGLGLGIALLACASLAVTVLSLAREIGMLRLHLGPQSALEIPNEGPELGSRTALVERFEPGRRTELALAVFVSESCHLCRALEPAIASLRRDPVVALETFDEDADASVWAEHRVPGSPYAVALDLAGIVLAKGTFNTIGQLESLLATAERRRASELEGVHA